MHAPLIYVWPYTISYGRLLGDALAAAAFHIEIPNLYCAAHHFEIHALAYLFPPSSWTDVFAQVLHRARVRASPMCDMWYRAYVRKRVYVRGCTARRLAGRAPQELPLRIGVELFMQLPFAGTNVALFTQGAVECGGIRPWYLF